MSARAATVWFIDSPAPADELRTVVRAPAHDHQHAQQLASKIYGDSVLVPLVDTDLATAAAAKDHHVYAGFYGSLAVISCSLFETATPSMLTRTLTAIRPSAVTTLLYTEPETSFGAFARWESGSLRRSFSADPVTIHEDDGLPFTFEKPFWGGEFPLTYAEGVPNQGMALPFHPAQLAEEANRSWLGFRYTHPLAPTDLDPADITVTCFALHPAEYEPTADDFENYRRATAARAGERAAPEGTPRKRGRFREYFGF
ncbi:hypothetical protein RVF83_11445 [Gordonia rubripertincta]|uniref:Uncharacterized protein n=2 Tax=Gordonia rubripertincta TaxID=36822 RepID=A0AAW6RD65_GORRU|nr:hypothetical protein [Gordonia rubripertincta]MDG6782386.1 hypothetical protein [Gordonia rubripertincta]NKY64483.1 hypothetical protein [Gordonia rubripertincta]GAB84890.1 hypothetical protein GORBP_049_00580 [Gordonia rubripertincta NBRC 101908]